MEQINSSRQNFPRTDVEGLTLDYTQTVLRHVDRINNFLPQIVYTQGTIDRHYALGSYINVRILHSMVEPAVPNGLPFREKAAPYKTKLAKSAINLLETNNKYETMEFIEELLNYLDLTYSQFKWLGMLPALKGTPYFPKPEENTGPYVKDWDK
jgi:hypothetical protein